MRAYDIIKKKREGLSLSRNELSSFLNGYLKGEIPDYQVSSFLMAVFFQGMNADETVSLTDIMLNSGSALDLSDIPGPKVDKHSTGGIGDKVSIILAPLVASAGVKVPMMSGRGLGHTGGTLDKLESIPGFKTGLSIKEFKKVLSEAGCAMIGASEKIAPLDRKLYALRDVTATVESIPLITASIMSKKLSEGIQGLVLDVKLGSGAFMKDLDSARELAMSMVQIGNSLGVKTIAAITDMDQPLGMTIGNSLEVIESIDAMKGKGPEDLMEVTFYLGALMLKAANMEADIEAGKNRLKQLIDNGSAIRKFKEMVEMQGGNPDIVERPDLLPSAGIRVDIRSPGAGYIRSMDAEAVGISAMILGAGRERMDSIIDHSAGILLKKKTGDFMEKNEIICMFFTNDEAKVKKAEELFLGALVFGDKPPEKKKMIIEVIE
jgi:pyrimidine-nucleoside phosphorylase